MRRRRLSYDSGLRAEGSFGLEVGIMGRMMARWEGMVVVMV